MFALRALLKSPQLLNLTGYEYDTNNVNAKVMSEGSRTEVLELIKQARIFLIDPSLLQKRAELKRQIDELPMAIPFPICWFETTLDQNKNLTLLYEKTTTPDHRELKIAQLGMLIKEIKPNLYDLFCVETVRTDNPRLGLNFSIFRNVPETMSKENDYLFPMQMILRLWLDTLRSNSLGLETTPNEYIRIPSKEFVYKTKAHRISTVIRISSKHKESLTHPISKGGHIDWSHKWEVRGHWRKLMGSTIGKDRDGDYLIPGFTWVSEHVKGPEDAILIPKTRIAK